MVEMIIISALVTYSIGITLCYIRYVRKSVLEKEVEEPKTSEEVN